MNVMSMDVNSDGPGRGAWRLYPIGDLHLDGRSTDRQRIDEYIKFIAADPCSVYVVVGDLWDGTVSSHRFFEPSTIRPEVVMEMSRYVDLMAEELTELFAPLEGRPGIFIQGNHDIRRGVEFSGIVGAVARRVGARYGGDECMARIVAKNATGSRSTVWTLHAHHGAGGGMYPGGKVNRFQNTVGQLADCDIYIRGHVHDSDARIVHIYGISRTGKPAMVKRPRAFLTAPSFSPDRTEGLNNYASRKGYGPQDQGITFLHCHNPRLDRDIPQAMYREEWRG